MRMFRALVSLSLCAVLAGAAPLPALAGNLPLEFAEQRYLDAYTLVRQAFEDKTQGRFESAIEKFQTARSYLSEIQRNDPEWHSQTVSFLLADCEKQIRSLEKEGVSRGQSQKRIQNLTQEMLLTMQKNRYQEAERRQPARSYDRDKVPTLSEELQPPKPERRKAFLPTFAERKEPRSAPRREIRPSGDSFLNEKVEALQAGFVSQKKETEQWKLQYSILEQKAKEEIRALSSEFAKEKADFEAQVASFNKVIEQSKAAQEQLTERIKQAEIEKGKQEEIVQDLKKKIEENQESMGVSQEEQTKQQEKLRQTQAKVEELERALEEAQKVRTQAEEEAKIREGKNALKLQQDFEEKSQELEKRAEQLEEEYAISFEQIEAEKRVLSGQTEETSRQLEQKLVNLVKEKSLAEEKVQKLESDIKVLSQQNQELIKNDEKIVLEKKLAQVERDLKSKEEAFQKLNEEKAFFLEQEKKFAVEIKDWQQRADALKKQNAKTEEELNRARYEVAEREATIRQVLTQTETQTSQIKAENEKTVMDLLESFKKEKAKWREELVRVEAQAKGPKRVEAAVADPAEAAARREMAEKLAKIGEENSQFQTQLQSEKKKAQEFSKLVETSENEKKELYEEVNRLNETVTKMKIELKRLENTNNELRGSLASKPIVTTEEKKVEPAPIRKEISAPKPQQEKPEWTEEKTDAVIQQVREKIQEGKNEGALQILENGLRQSPQNDKLLFYQGLIFSRMNELEKARDGYLAAIAANPKMDKAYNNLGNLLSKQGKYSEAIEYLTKATELNPKLSEAFNNMGIVYSHLGQYDQAIKAFIRATELSPTLVAAYYNLGQIYFQDGKVEAARATFEKVLSIDPSHAEAKSYLAKINQGDATPVSRASEKD